MAKATGNATMNQAAGKIGEMPGRIAATVDSATRRMSPEARERIATAARKRWAAHRKAKAKTAKS